MNLSSKHIVVTGVVDDASIATAIAERCLELGAELSLTAPSRDLERAGAVGDRLGLRVIELDVNDHEHWRRADAHFASIGPIDGAVHAVAFAPRTALDGSVVDADPVGLDLAFTTSVASYAWLARLVRDHAPPGGASIVGLDFDASRAWPTYNWMGVCKAALESLNRYVARDLASLGIRANLVAAGPLRTRAAGGIPGFELLVEAWDERSPLPWAVDDPAPVADAVCFLLSEASRATSGEILHVDGGFHAMAVGGSRSPVARTPAPGPAVRPTSVTVPARSM